MIVGRKKELAILEKIYRSKEAEFITIYGRRRVGKTYLIREFFGQKEVPIFACNRNKKRQCQNTIKKI